MSQAQEATGEVAPQPIAGPPPEPTVERGPEVEPNIAAVYSATVSTFNKLTEIRFKLLAMLPAATAIGVYVLKGGTDPGTTAIAMLGLLVTLALATYNARNNQHYDELVSQAADLERRLGVRQGAFTHRPRPWAKCFLFKINHGGPVLLIYAATTATWIFIVLQSCVNIVSNPYIQQWMQPLHLALYAVIVTILGTLCIRKQIKAEETATRDAARSAFRTVKEANKINIALFDPGDASARLLKKDLMTLKGKSDGIVDSLKFYLTEVHSAHYLDADGLDDENDERRRDLAIAQLLGLVTEMPPRWIFDIGTHRRGMKHGDVAERSVRN